MADTRGRQAVKLVDPTTNANEAAVSAAGALRVDIAATAAALADATANPTTSLVGAPGLVFNGSTWDRRRSVTNGQDSAGTGVAASGILGQLDDTATGTVTENQFAPVRISTRRALLVEGVASGTSIATTVSGTVTVDSELPAAAALSDNFANPTAPGVGAFGMVWDGATWDRQPGTSTDGALVNLGVNNDVVVSGTVTVDSELPAAAALADATANPTVPGVGAFGLGYNGTTWDRIRVANTGRLQVDVITGGGTETPTNPVLSYQTSAALAAGSSAALTTAEATSKKLRKVVVWSSVPFKATLHTVDNASESAVKTVGGGQAAQAWTFDAPHRNYITLGATAGLDAFRVNVTNLDNNTAADVYASFFYED